jgi:hypothetical protein
MVVTAQHVTLTDRRVAQTQGEGRMAKKKYSRKASKKVERAMHERKRGTLRSGRSGKKVISRKQAIAIGLSQARKAGARVPRKKSSSSRSPSRSRRKSSRR